MTEFVLRKQEIVKLNMSRIFVPGIHILRMAELVIEYSNWNIFVHTNSTWSQPNTYPKSKKNVLSERNTSDSRFRYRKTLK